MKRPYAELHTHSNFSFLDGASHIEELVLQLGRRLTVVIVTHNLQQATRVADRTAFFFLGRLVEYASTFDLFTNPRDTRTEAYVSGRFG